MQGVPYLAAVVGLLGLMVGCRGCEKGPGASPTRFIQKNAEAVIEVKDLGALAKSKAKLTAALSRVMTAQQLDAIEKEAALVLGFDPATEKGLEEAGLPKSGGIAGETTAGGQGALWVVPFENQAKLEKVIDHIARARMNVEAVEKVKLGDKDATVLTTTFGPEKISVAAYAFDKGFAIIGAGPKAKELVAHALTVASDPEGDVTHDPEWIALDRALGRDADARMFVLRVNQAAAAAVPQIERMLGRRFEEAEPVIEKTKTAKSVGVGIRFHDRGATVSGRARFDATGLQKLAALLVPGRPAPSAIQAVDLDDAFLFGFAWVNPEALIAEAAPAGSALRKELDRAFESSKAALGIDVEKEIVPNLTGQGAFAMGIESLANADLRMLLQSPGRYLWSALVVGTPHPDRLAAIEKRAEPKFGEEGLALSSGKLEDRDVLTLKPKGSDTVFLESTAGLGAFLMTTDAKVMERLVRIEKADKPGKGPLDGKPGAFFELRFFALAKALDQLDLTALPVLYRAIAGKGIEVMHALDRGSLAVTPAEDGLAFEGRLQLAP
jgi:hypothetical protein